MLRALALLLLCSVSSAQLTAVELARGEELVTLARVGDTLMLQSGSLLITFARDFEVTGTTTVPTGAYVWDVVGPDILAITEGGVVKGPLRGGPVERIAEAGDLFRGRLTAPAARRPFARPTPAGVSVVVPSLDSLAWLHPELTKVSTTAGAKDDLGWGLGYRMSARVTVPFFALDGEGLLYRTASELRRRTAAADRAWGKAPVSENTRMLKFEHAIAPLAADFDGDGRDDLIMTDPGEGFVFCYRGARRPANDVEGPDQLMKLDEWVLWRWLVDADGDGRDDLVLLTMPKVGLLGQLGVIRKRAVKGVLSVRRQEEAGAFETSPSVKAKMELPISISVTRDRKDIRFRTPVVPFRTKGGFAFLGPDEDGVPRLHTRDGDGWKTGEPVPAAAVDEGYVEAAFEPALTDLDGDGDGEISFIVRGRSDVPDVAVMLR